VTDADLLLGYLNAEYFLGGQMDLDVDCAADAVDEFARFTGLDRVRAAQGIHDLVNENMANAARVHAAERGIDLNGYSLVATGGAGPVHACGVAMRLGIDRVIVPPAAGVGSAFGLMLAPIAFDYVRSFVSRIAALEREVVNKLYEEMEDEGRALVREAGIDDSEIRVVRTADMRYVGQGHEISVPVPLGELTEGSDALQAAFDASYKKLYGRLCEGVPVEAIHWRVTVSGPEPEICDVVSVGEVAGDQVSEGQRDVLFANDKYGTEVYKRHKLGKGVVLKGPAIVEEVESTTVLPPGWVLQVDDTGNLILMREDA
jgi:N-methylhydantoinase A